MSVVSYLWWPIHYECKWEDCRGCCPLKVQTGISCFYELVAQWICPACGREAKALMSFEYLAEQASRIPRPSEQKQIAESKTFEPLGTDFDLKLFAGIHISLGDENAPSV